MKLHYGILVLLLVASIGCSDFGEDPTINFSGQDGFLTVTNYAGRTIYYFASEQQVLELSSWEVTTNPFAPNRIENGATKKISFYDIRPYKIGDTIVFFYWTLDPKPDGGFVATNLKHAILTPSYLVLNSFRFPIN